MNDCTFDEEMIDVAFGVAPSPALLQHLESCPTCSSNIERRRTLAQQIDTVVQARVYAEPPSYLAERIVEQAQSARTRRWNNRRLGVPIGAALAAAVLLVVFGLNRPVTTQREADTAALTAWRSPTESLLTQHVSIVRTPLDLQVEHLL